MIKRLFFLSLFIPTISFAYNPPIGIPDPGMWGATHPIDSSAPDTATKCPSWPAAQATDCYYIDNTHPKATDTSNTYGYPDKPRLTIPYVSSYPAGSYIEIHGGRYNTTPATITAKGTPEAPVWIRGASSDAMPDMGAKLYLKDSTYTIIENLDFNNFAQVAVNIVGLNSNNICVRNSKFRNLTTTTPTAAISSTPFQNGIIHDLVFYNNTFDTLGNVETTVDIDFLGIGVDLWGRTPPTTLYNVWALNNSGYKISGVLFQSNGDQRDVPKAINEGRTVTNIDNLHHMYMGFNVHAFGREGLSSMKMTRDAIISQNVAHSGYNPAAGHGTGAHMLEGPDYVWIIFNTFYNMTYGVRQSNMYYDMFRNQKSFVIGNVIYDMNEKSKKYIRTDRYKPSQGIDCESARHQRYFIDNTIYNVGGGIVGTCYHEDDLVENSGNVIAGVTGIDDNGAPDFHMTAVVNPGIFNTDYSFFQPRQDNGTVTFFKFNNSPQIMNSLSAYQATGQCQNCWAGDPMFADPSNHDFHPQANSPLIGKNIRHSVYDEFKKRYGISIDYDIEGKPRPFVGRTLGALEPGYAKMAPLPTPQAPTPHVVR